MKRIENGVLVGGMVAFTALVAIEGATAQAVLGATLVANTALSAEWVNSQTNTVVSSQTHPAGPLTSAVVRAQQNGGDRARYDCVLGGSGTGPVTFTANSLGHASWPYAGVTHADLTLTVVGMGAVSIEADLSHLGDGVISGAFRVDVGDDGTDELTAACACGSPLHHRLWTWDFANGNLVIRIRTDQHTYPSAQWHTLELQIRSWSTHATPVAEGCVGISSTPYAFLRETSNYQLNAQPTSQVGQLLSLRAYGFGDLGFFIASSSATVAPVQLANPLTVCPALADILLVDAGSVTSWTTAGAPTPRSWRLIVPALPPGLCFHVQHGSFSPAPATLGTSNVIRIDT